jgi:hypothetical protein
MGMSTVVHGNLWERGPHAPGGLAGESRWSRNVFSVDAMQPLSLVESAAACTTQPSSLDAHSYKAHGMAIEAHSRSHRACPRFPPGTRHIMFASSTSQRSSTSICGSMARVAPFQSRFVDGGTLHLLASLHRDPLMFIEERLAWLNLTGFDSPHAMQMNDVFFAIHAVILTFITVFQVILPHFPLSSLPSHSYITGCSGYIAHAVPYFCVGV